MRLTNHLYRLPKLRTTGAVPPLSVHTYVAYIGATILVPLRISTRSQYKEPPLQHIRYKLDDDDDNNNNDDGGGKSGNAFKRTSNW